MSWPVALTLGAAGLFVLYGVSKRLVKLGV